VLACNCILFVPGSRPDRFAKAREAGAGLTVIDLEDAVAMADKASARDAALAAIQPNPSGWAIRINGVASVAGVRDLCALESAEVLPEYLFVPMVERARDLEVVHAVLGARCPGLVPLIETPRGLRHGLEIAKAPMVAGVMLGGGDLAGELGVELSWEPLLAARQLLLLACGEARVCAIDVPFVALDDEKGLTRECAKAHALGFSAKAAIHPRQVPAIEAAFAPSPAQLAEAREAIAAYEAAGGRAVRFEGRMLEAPLIRRYRSIIARSENKRSKD